MKNNLTYKQIRLARRAIYKKAHAPGLRIGGFRGAVSILKRPITFFGVLLGIALIGFGFFRGGIYLYEFVFGGLGIGLTSFLSPVIGFSTALLYGAGIYLLAPFVALIINISQTGFNQETASFLITLIPTFILLAALFGLSIFLQNKIRQRPAYTVINKDNALRITDLFLHDIAPLSLFPYLIKITIHPPFGTQPRQLISIHSSLAKFCDNLEIILAGTRITEDMQPCMTCYIYAPSATAESAIRARVDKFSMQAQIQTIEDREWAQFTQDLMPSEYDMYEMYNRNVYQSLTKNRVDTAIDKTLLYVLSFEDKNDARLCADAATQNGYNLTKDGESPIHEGPAKELRRYMVILEMKSKLGLERLNINCHNIIDLAHQFNGRLQNWSIKNY